MYDLLTFDLQHCLLEENPDALKVKIKVTDVCPAHKLSFDCLLHILSYLPLIDLCRYSMTTCYSITSLKKEHCNGPFSFPWYLQGSH